MNGQTSVNHAGYSTMMEAEIKPIMTSSSSNSSLDSDLTDTESVLEQNSNRQKCCCVFLVLAVVAVICVIIGVSVPQLLHFSNMHTTSSTPLKPPTPLCSNSCSLSLVESIPENLTYPPSAPQHNSTYDSWVWLLENAHHNVNIVSFYWVLNDKANTTDPTDSEGADIYHKIIETAKRDVHIRVVQSTADGIYTNNASKALSDGGYITLRNLDMKKLLGSGVLHTKLWIVDDEHFYVGSANMDWRSLTQVKELGLFGRNCSCLAKDAQNMFEVYWSLAIPGASIPKHWDPNTGALTNQKYPASLPVNGTMADIYWAFSPPRMCTNLRTDDLSALLNVISQAEQFIYIAVMDYAPASLYDWPHKYWPIIDDALRNASFEKGINVRLLASYWEHTERQQLNFVNSLKAFNDSGRGRIETKYFIVPPLANKNIPFTRVNHNKYMVTDKAAYIGTSNWSEDYFTFTGGVSCIVNQTASHKHTTIQYQLKEVFERDWTSQYSHDTV